MSDTGTFELTPIFNEMLNGLGPDHAVWDIDPAAVLVTDSSELFVEDVLQGEVLADLPL